MYIVIAGCGRLGSGLSRILSSEGNDVAVVDRSMDRRRLGSAFDGLAIDGDPIDPDALVRAGIEKADLFVAVTSDDNVNAAAVTAAMGLFSVPRAIARFVDPARERFYRSLGVEGICPTETGINQILDFIRNRPFSLLDAAVNPNMTCVFPSEEWIGLRPREIKMPSGGRLIGFVRGSKFHGPEEGISIRSDDSIVVSQRRE